MIFIKLERGYWSLYHGCEKVDECIGKEQKIRMALSQHLATTRGSSEQKYRNGTEGSETERHRKRERREEKERGIIKEKAAAATRENTYGRRLRVWFSPEHCISDFLLGRSFISFSHIF